jgi:hypothetical protein
MGRILIVGMADSIHLARWLQQFEDDELEILIISSSPHRKVHPIIEKYLNSGTSKFKIQMPAISRKLSLLLWIADRVLGDILRGTLIAHWIKRFKPDFIHVNELQNAGYATLQALRMLNPGEHPPVFTTNYGSELVWFGKIQSHRKKLVRLLEASSAFSAECHRDYILAREMGFGGYEMPLMPVAGGLRLSSLEEPHRQSIAIKGYQNKWGRALTVLDAMENLSPIVSDFKIEVFSCNRAVMRRIRRLNRNKRLDIIGYPKGTLSHAAMMSLFKRSLIYIGFSLSDGISTSMIEAMANGAIPIQTCTSCADEWLTTGQTGYILSPSDSPGLESAIKSILTGQFNVEFARSKNQEVIEDKYDPEKLRAIAKSQYAKMLALVE